MSEVCHRCGGERWVCENHPDEAWSEHGCTCGAGMPCGLCNVCDEFTPPALPPGTTIICSLGDYDD